MNQETTSSNSINIARIVAALPYALIPVFILLWRGAALFSVEPIPDSYNLDRLAWCILCSFSGFFLFSSLYWKNSESPFPKYIFYYPGILLVMSSLVFSICHLNEASSTFIFYPLSFSLCAILVTLSDKLLHLVPEIVKKIGV